VSELYDDQAAEPFEDEVEDEVGDDDLPEPERGRVPPGLPEHVPDDWLDQKPFDPSGR
jgi:hypothetical protein